MANQKGQQNKTIRNNRKRAEQQSKVHSALGWRQQRHACEQLNSFASKHKRLLLLLSLHNSGEIDLRRRILIVPPLFPGVVMEETFFFEFFAQSIEAQRLFLRSTELAPNQVEDLKRIQTCNTNVYAVRTCVCVCLCSFKCCNLRARQRNTQYCKQ